MAQGWQVKVVRVVAVDRVGHSAGVTLELSPEWREAAALVWGSWENVPGGGNSSGKWGEGGAEGGWNILGIGRLESAVAPDLQSPQGPGEEQTPQGRAEGFVSLNTVP